MHFRNRKGESMKRKIALLLALAMVLSLIPANLFANPGTVSVPLQDSTYGRSEAYGSEWFTVSIPMTLLRGASFHAWTPNVYTGQGLPLYVRLTGTGDGNLRFPEDNRWARHWQDGVNLPYQGPTWPLLVDSHAVRYVHSELQVINQQLLTAQFFRAGHQSGWAVLNMNENEPAFNPQPEIHRAAITVYQHQRTLALSYAEQAAIRFANLQRLATAIVTTPGSLGTPAQPVPANDAAWRASITTAVNRLIALPTVPSNGNVTPTVGPTAPPIANVPHQPVNAANPAQPSVHNLVNNLNAALAALAIEIQGLLAAPAIVPADALTALATLQALPLWNVIANGADNLDALAFLFEDALWALGQTANVDNPIEASWPLVPQGADGNLDITFPVHRVRHQDARIEVRLGGPNGRVVAEGPLAAFEARGIAIEEGDIVVFEHTAVLETLTIRELSPGVLVRHVNADANRNQSVAIRLTAPAGYVWDRNVGTNANITIDGVTHPQTIWHNTHNTDVRQQHRPPTWVALYNDPHAPGSPFITSPLNLMQWHCTVDGIYTLPDGRQEMLIIFDNLTRNPAFPLIPGAIQLHNLRLIAGPDAPAVQEEVNIDVRVGTVCAYGYRGWINTFPNPQAPTGMWCVSMPGGATPAPPSPPPQPTTPGALYRPDAPAASTPPPVLTQNTPCYFFSNPGRFPTSLAQVTTTAANQVGTQLALGWRNLPSGTGATPAAPGHTRTDVTVARRAEAGLELSVYGNEVEMVSGSVDNWANNSVNMLRTGRTQRLVISEIVANALQLSPGHPITFTFPEGVQVVGIHYRVYPYTVQRGFPWETRNAGQQWNIQTRFVDANTVTVANTLNRHYATREMHVYFDIAVEAGFVAKHGTSDINVTVTGPGVALLPQTANTIAVAQVVDPITVTFPAPINIEEFGREHNLLQRTPIGNIVIEEAEAGMLEMGTEVEVFIARSFIQRPYDITLVPGTVVIDDNSGLRLTAMETFSEMRAGARVVGVRFTVTAQSRVNAGRVTLQGNDIFGHVYPGEEYWLVVSGDAIAANHAVVHGESRVNSPAAWNHNRPIPGVFTTMPFYSQLIDYVTGGDETTERPRANSLRGVTFSPDVDFEGAPQMIWHRADGMRHEAGFVGARAFATVAGVTPDNIEWASGVATIAGWDYQGRWVRITLTQGSTEAQIVRGSAPGLSDILVTTVDIAAFAEGLSGPTGTVYPVFRHNRIYLPFRFLFNAFGYSADYTLHREGNVAVVR